MVTGELPDVVGMSFHRECVGAMIGHEVYYTTKKSKVKGKSGGGGGSRTLVLTRSLARVSQSNTVSPPFG